MKLLARERVAVWLLEHQHSKRWLAKKLGVSPSLVSMLVAGHRRPSLLLAKRIQKLTGIPAIDFAGHSRAA